MSKESRYDPTAIEPRWQRHWQEHGTFRAVEDSSKPKYYVLDMFPYPSGAGLHVGHPEGYTATDILARYKRMRGFRVLHPMGWDSFGLPAEQYALDHGVHPATVTAKNIETFRGQLQRLGFSYDWEREIATSSPDYYRWTQWIFLKLFARGLAYMAEVPVNWCPALGTVLANEEVIDGKSERGGHPVIRRPMKQWMLRITAYADRLLADLDELDWPESLKEMQRNWIGRSEGAQVRFKVAGREEAFEVFTTRPDTLFGATYCVLAPEHPLVEIITTPDRRDAVDAYRQAAASKSDLERTELTKEKTGVFTGAYAVNPANGESVPVWIADYVLASYGTGAIMAVPGHDERDWEFATKLALPVREVVRGSEPANLEEGAYTEPGVAVNSGFLDGLATDQAKQRMIAWLEEEGVGTRKVNYRLRDWLFSRQRYWGEPIPVLHLEDGSMKALSEQDLPLLLPEVPSIKPSGTGESPLAAIPEWVNTTDPDTGKPARRETNTMPQWAGSCWYYLRFMDPKNAQAAWDPAKERYWGPVDLYVGGTEHAVLHLLYARFWHKVLYDEGLVHTKEPFQRLVNQGMILGENGEKMSKSRGNVVNPDDIVREYGADTLRLYEMFMGPLEATKPWNTKGVEGCFRFIQRVWRMFDADEGFYRQQASEGPALQELVRQLHRTIKKITEDIEGLRFNTAISQLMIFVNAVYKAELLTREIAEPFVLVLSPFAPHLAEELWERLGHSESLACAPWPSYDEALTQDELVELAIQVNGKIRARITIEVEAPEDEVLRRAKAEAAVAEALSGKAVVKEIVVPGRLVNLVVK